MAESNLRRAVRQTHRSGTYVHGKIESIINGKAVVDVLCSSQKLTNLDVIGDLIKEGDYAIIDYSSGTPPVVRGFDVDFPDLEFPEISFPSIQLDIDVSTDLDFETSSYPSDVSLSLRGPAQIVTRVPEYVRFDEHTYYDTHDFFSPNSPTEIVLPYNGVYFVAAQLMVSGGPEDVDMQEVVEATISGSYFGEFGYDRQSFLWAGWHDSAERTSCPMMLRPSGFIVGKKGEIIRVSISHSCDTVTSLDLYNTDTSPALQLFRLGGTESNSHSESTVTGYYPELADDADIEIRSDQGYMYILDTSSYTRAIANAQEKSDQDLTLDFVFGDIESQSNLSLFLRSSLDWYDWQTPTRAYEMQLQNNGSWRIYRIENGVRTLLGNVNSPATTSDQKLRFQVSSTAIRAKRWMATESEPASWDFDISDTGGFTTAGGFQLGHFAQVGSHQLKVDNVNLGTP